MRKYIIIPLMLLLCFCTTAAFSSPAYPKGRKVKQPDGTTITIYGHGDEFLHFLTTADGTVVAKGADGFYRPTGQDARRMAKAKSTSKLKRMKPVNQKWGDKPYRGLVLLVNFNDRKFSRGNIKSNDFYNKLMSGENFTFDNDKFYGPMVYTGSVRDYYIDNSNGRFKPDFDVVGPIDMDVSQYYINGVENAYDLAAQVLEKADETVDFTKYDADGDGTMDMVYIIYAGYASHYDGNDEQLVWPHAGEMGDVFGDDVPVHDGIKMGRFAASAEIFGWHEDGDLLLDGIGVIVHEFSHILGFMDHYDTSGGYQEDPNAWDVMSAGCYSDDLNRTPCGFNSYEKQAAGFVDPLDLTKMGGTHIEMQSTETNGDACLIRSYQEHVNYFMENRQPNKWDKNLPGHGLLVWRVDSVRPEYWKQNIVNVTTRACFRLVRACGTQGSFLTGVEDTDFDPFPGTRNITELDNDEDAANLVSYDQFPCPVVLRNIAEQDGIISFDVEDDPLAENRPITYTVPARFYGYGEHLVGDEWVPMTWTVTGKTVNGKPMLQNFLPNTENLTSTNYDFSKGIYVEYRQLDDDNHTMIVEAQRLSVNSDYGTWICDISNVQQQGTGAMNFTIGRYGIPSLVDPSATLGYCNLKPTAFIISQRNLISEVACFRNVTFSSNKFDTTGIADTDFTADKVSKNTSRKYLSNGRFIIERNGRKYNAVGVSY